MVKRSNNWWTEVPDQDKVSTLISRNNCHTASKEYTKALCAFRKCVTDSHHKIRAGHRYFMGSSQKFVGHEDCVEYHKKAREQKEIEKDYKEKNVITGGLPATKSDRLKSALSAMNAPDDSPLPEIVKVPDRVPPIAKPAVVAEPQTVPAVEIKEPPKRRDYDSDKEIARLREENAYLRGWKEAMEQIFSRPKEAN